MTQDKKTERYLRRKALREEKLRLEEESRERAATEQRKLDEKYMRMAIRLARRAEESGDVPIGCVIVHDGKVIGRGYNRRNRDRSTLMHAEIIAIRKASRVLGDWRLEDCTLYVTLEPCQMCAGAIVQARIPTVVIGCMSPKSGCAGSVINLLEMDGFNHKAEVRRGICEEETSEMLSSFFKRLRTTD